jgi:ribosome-binding ATPase YchF (GTP1/OBG family)
MDVALIGLASSGKTSLLKALAAGHLPAHGNPNEPAVAVVKVPDERLEKLAKIFNPRVSSLILLINS